jgi:hypothetical protein
MGHCGAEISNSFKSNKSTSFSPDGFETVLLLIECLAFRSPARIDFRLKRKNSVMSASFQARP